MQRQKSILSPSVRSENARAFRSFKLRFISWYLPAAFLLAGLLTVSLVWFSQRSYANRQQSHVLERFARHGEYLRMAILSKNFQEMSSYLEKVSEQLDLSEIVVYDGSSRPVASFSQVVTATAFSEIRVPLIVQENSSKAEEIWVVAMKIPPGPFLGLIDSFMFYQLLILAALVIFSVAGTFFAFDSIVIRPLQSLKYAMREMIGGSNDGLAAIIENDEVGEACSIFNELAKERAKEARLVHSFSMQAGIVCFKYDPATDFFEFSGRFPETLNFDVALLKSSQELFAMTHPDVRGECKQEWYDLRERFRTEESGHREIDLKLYNPKEEFSGATEENWVRMIIDWLSIDGRRQIRGIIKDITQMRQREAQLKSQAESFRMIYENSPVGIWRCVCNNDRYYYMNHAMARILGYRSPEEAIEKIQSISRDVFFNPGERAFFLDEVKKRDQVGNFELRLRKADGTIFWGALFGRLFTDHNVQYCEGGLIDITERKQLDEQLRSNEEFLRQGLEASGLVLWQLDPVTGRMHLKGSIKELLGSGLTEATSLKVLQRLVHPEDLARFGGGIDRLRRGESIQGNDHSRFEFRICKVDEAKRVEIRWLTASAVRSETLSGGRQGHINGFFFDITAQKDAEIRLTRAVETAKAESRQKSEFFAGVSHEVRTPLNAIIGFSELLLPMIENSKGQHFMNSILSSSRSLINILNSMLDLSRLEAGKVELVLEPVRINELIADIRQSHLSDAERRNLEFKVKVADNVPPVLILDEFRLRQVISNLLTNSFHYTASGSVNLSVLAAVKQPQQSVDLSVSVHDTGQGIHSDDLADLFKPFSQKNSFQKSHGSGAGLGLAICRHLVELMGGRIRVKSEIQCGSHFEILLRDVKIAASENAAAPASLERQHYRFDGQKILVADDTASNRELMAEAMRSSGLQVVCAADGEEAVQMAIKEQPELILMDIRMPRKDGVAAVKELRVIPALSGVPVVAVTASASAREHRELTELFDGFIYKPVSLLRLFAEAAKHLKHKVREDHQESRPAMMSAESFEQLSDPWRLVESISKEYMPALKEFEGAVAIENVSLLAESLKALALRHSCNLLTIEAERLKASAEKFDLAGIDDARKHIRMIFEQILQLYQRQLSA